VPYLGRDLARTDLEQLTGYGSTLVERVRNTGEALVVTGSEEGAALGSKSTLVHGLRSIMVAPLVVNSRVIGVIYLDSRAVKGIFTADDVGILGAIVNQIALSMETARAAQLELAVHAAERQRDLAQLLHGAMTDLGASLDPDEVVRRLISSVVRVLPIDTAVVLRSEPDGKLVATGSGDPLDGTLVDPDADATLAGLLASTSTLRGSRPGQPGGVAADPPRSTTAPAILGEEIDHWMSIPLTIRGERRGLLLAGSAAGRPYSDAEAEIATAMAGQGIVALENALLFRKVEELATRDGLTGLMNRRYFFDIAERFVSAQRRDQTPLAALMIDIDHFKRVNDTFGHAAGDEVIREVARRLSDRLRAHDLICRYGGEEFAILLHNITGDHAATVAEALRTAVTREPVRVDGRDLPVTVSVGLAVPADREMDVHALLSRADDALYAAKRGGRNRVEQFADG